MVDFLSPNRLKVIIWKYPELQLTAQKINIPMITVNPAHVSTNNNKDSWYPGDKMEFEDLIVTFIVDEQLSGYKAVKDWLYMITDLDDMRPEYFSDITVEALSNNYQPNQSFYYHHCFPYQVGGGVMDVSLDETTPITFDCVFKYNNLEIKNNAN